MQILQKMGNSKHPDDGRGDGVVRRFGIDLMGEFLGGQSRELPVPAQQLSGRGRFGGG